MIALNQYLANYYAISTSDVNNHNQYGLIITVDTTVPITNINYDVEDLKIDVDKFLTSYFNDWNARVVFKDYVNDEENDSESVLYSEMQFYLLGSER